MLLRVFLYSQLSYIYKSKSKNLINEVFTSGRSPRALRLDIRCRPTPETTPPGPNQQQTRLAYGCLV